MTSLSEVYERDGGSGTSLRRLYFGLGLFAAGVVMLVAGIVVATTDVLRGGGTTLTNVRHLGGLLAGVGVPAVFLGIFAVLPSGRRTKATAVIGASIAVLGVGLFWHAYPCQWSGSNCGAGLMDLTLPTVVVYFAGTMTTFWSLFVGVANFKTRNDPGGTVKMEVTRKGETKIVEVERSSLGRFGGVGLFGDTPDGEVETQTASATVSDGGASSSGIVGLGDTSTADTGTQSPDRVGSGSNRDASSTASPDGPTRRSVSDVYCGNCAHFQYVRTEDGIRPHCGYHSEVMDDMDACESWTGRSETQ
ncbi:MAG: ribonuclease BN [Haloferacaceae archaeon]